MKKYISILLRKLGAAGAADRLRFNVVSLKRKKANRLFAAQHPSFSFPPDYFIYETFALSYKEYFEQGQETAWELKKIADPYFNFAGTPKAILDWGCGPGRVIRHLPGIAGNIHEYSACDYNDTYIKWCSAHISGIRFFKNELSPPLDMKDNTQDLIYGLSILTHLSEKAHHQWMDEFFRVLKPGGILILTTHGDAAAAKLTARERLLYDRGDFTERSFLKEGHRMYSSFQPQKFMDRLISRFILLCFMPGHEHGDLGFQDCRVLQKPLNPNG